MERLLALGLPKGVPGDEQEVLGRFDAMRVLLGEQKSPW